MNKYFGPYRSPERDDHNYTPVDNDSLTGMLLRTSYRPMYIAQPKDTSDSSPTPFGDSDPISSISDLRLNFDYQSRELLRDMVSEPEVIRGHLHKETMDRITQLSLDLSACSSMCYGQQPSRQKTELEREKWGLERELVDIDLRCWSDVSKIRERLLQTEERYAKTKLNTDLFSSLDA